MADSRHVALGLFARALPPGDEFVVLHEACEGIKLADSITGDAHKCLDVVCMPNISIQIIVNPFRLSPLPIPSDLSYKLSTSEKQLNIPLYSLTTAVSSSPLPVSLLISIFRNPKAAYVSSGIDTGEGQIIPSPLNIGIENSRRFRALPVYAVLLAHGRTGPPGIFTRQIRLARLIAAFCRCSPSV